MQRGRHYDVVAAPVFDESGELMQVILAYLDITARSQATRALVESEERYRDLFENANDLIQSVRPDGTFAYVSRAWLNTLGYTEEEVRGLSVFDVIAPECREHCRAAFETLMDGRDVGRMEMTFLTRDGRRVLLEGNANCNLREGQTVATRAILRDITERTRMEAEMAKAQQLESLGVLAGGIAHDFNNLLTAILGNVTVARQHAAPEGELDKKLREAERATLRARDLTQQLLTFSRGGAPVLEEASIAELVSEAAGFALSGSKARWDLTAPLDLWVAQIDPAQIGQVVQNLVLNASQSMPDGGEIHVRLENLRVGPFEPFPLKGGSYVRLSVTDHGVGIPPDVRNRIFDPYFSLQ